jgi:hypothetical protein
MYGQNPWMQGVKDYWSKYSAGGEQSPARRSAMGVSSINSGVNAAKAEQMKDQAIGYVKERAPMSIASTAANLAMGMPANTGNIVQSAIGGLTNPAALAGLVSRTAAQQMGLAQPTSAMGKVVNYGLPAVLGMVNPALGIVASVLGPYGYDAVADMADARDGEMTRDAMEDAYGYALGRQAFDKTAKDFARMGSVAGLYGLEGMVNDLDPDYYTAYSNNQISGLQRGPKGWAETTYGGLPQIRDFAEKMDRKEAAARAAESKARDGVLGALGGWGDGGGSGGSGTGHNDGASDRGNGEGGRGIY